MKRLLLLIALAVATPLLPTGCNTPPSSRVVQVQTLMVLGQTARAGMDASTQLLKQGTITAEQWQKIANFYDTRWQPAFNLAVAAVHSDLSSVGSPDLMALATQFSELIGQLTTKP